MNKVGLVTAAPSPLACPNDSARPRNCLENDFWTSSPLFTLVHDLDLKFVQQKIYLFCIISGLG